MTDVSERLPWTARCRSARDETPAGGPKLYDMTQQAAELWGTWTRLRDERSFESLVLPELPHAMGFARRLGCSAADAEDAVQDALARLAAVRDDSPASVGVRAWLCREVHVRARSRLRSERRRRTREAAASRPPESSGPDASAALRDEVERALADLDLDERSAVELRYLHDLDYREMGHVLGARPRARAASASTRRWRGSERGSATTPRRWSRRCRCPRSATCRPW
jgi:RNA polymerase sigma factor (sigma-70 family)